MQSNISVSLLVTSSTQRNRRSREAAVTDSGMTIDRGMVRQMVEEFWRLLVLQGYQWGQANPTMSRAQAEAKFEVQARDMSRKFTTRTEAIAALMLPEQAEVFLRMVEEEDAMCFEESQRDPEAFHRRLSLVLTATPSPQARATVKYRRQGIGEMAVRTAVRATIWEYVWSLLRR